MTRICGIEITGKSAQIVVLEIDDKKKIKLYKTKFTKIGLADHKKQADIHSFEVTIKAFFKDHDITIIAIKGRQKSGPRASDGITFKMEGIIQTSRIPVHIIYPVTINKALKNNKLSIDSTKLYKYQQEAFNTAICMTQKHLS